MLLATAFHNRGRKSRWSFGIVALLIVGVVAVAASREDVGEGTSAVGNALDDVATFTFSKEGIPPGERFVLLLNDVVNESSKPVKILRLEPLLDPDPDVAVLERLELAPRGGDRLPVEQGTHLTYPPASSLGSGKEDCAYQEVRSASGYVLPPNEGTDKRALMVMVIRSTGPGRTKFEVGRVVYEQEGELRSQDIRLVVDLSVSRKARPLKPAPEEAACMDESHVLPQPPAPFR